MSIQRIMVPVSFAPSCKKAFGMAATLAGAFGAKLYVVNVYKTLTRFFYNIGGAIFDEELRFERQKRLEDLSQFVQTELEKLSLSIPVEEVEVVDGDSATDTILKVAKQKNIDLIVLGHHEELKLEHYLFGRNINRIVDRAPCGVLVTRSTEYAKALEFEEAA